MAVVLQRLPEKGRRRPHCSSPCTTGCNHDHEGSMRMPMTTLDELFEHNLKDVYGAEQRLLESLDEMAGEATDREAKKLFQQHKKETQGQIKRLEKVFKTLGIKPEAQPCPGMEGLIKEKKSLSKERPSEDILGFYNLHAAQKVERYEITSYEGLIEAAQHMGMDEAVDLLQQNLDEEERTLDLLKQLASDYEVEQEEGEETEQEEEDEERVPAATGGRKR
jgi:ferritin-like metal-binding protein YciE